MFKNMRLVILFGMFLNPSFKMTASFVKIDKENGVFTLDQKIYDNDIQKITSDTSKFEKFDEDSTLKREALLQQFLRKLKEKKFYDEINIINCILLVLLQLVSMALLKCTSFPLVIHFLKFVQLFHL